MKIIIVLFSVILIVRGQQESIIRARCAALQTTADTFIRNSFNCRGYHVCRNRDYIGSALCGEGLYFDGDQRCEFSQNVECAVCSNPPLAGAEQVKVPGACNKYGLCINEEIFVQTCASGLIWGTNGCVDPGNPPPNPPPGTPLSLPCAACPNFYNTPAFVLVPDIWECNQFIRCFAIPTNPPGQAVASTREQCPNGVFDSTTSSCSTAPGATCGSAGAPEECPPGPGVVYLPDPSDCKFYFTCVNGGRLPDRTSCVVDYRFDPAVGACVPKSNPDCR